MTAVLAAVSLLLLSSCSSLRTAETHRPPPLPTASESLVFNRGAERPGISLTLSELSNATEENPTSFVDNLYRDYKVQPSSMTRLYAKAASRVAKVVRKHENMDGMISYYESKADKIEDKYKSVEGFVGKLGIGKDEFRTGLGITAAAATTAFGALHLVKPVAVFENIGGSDFGAGYDVSELDDPRMLISYADQYRLSFSKNGIGGSLGTKNGYVYTADLNIRNQSASANVNLNQGISLGTLYEHSEESVKGYVTVGF